MAKKKSESQDQAQPPRKYARYNVSAEEFIRTWQASATADEVAEKLGMPKPIVHARASSYRSVGIRLKKMPRPEGKTIDVEGLNALIDYLTKMKAEEEET
jgi:hypothetical protein